MNELDLSALREIALKATPGPWGQGMAGDTPLAEVDNRFHFGMVVLDEVGTDDGDRGLSTAAFIAEANPKTVLALLDLVHDLTVHVEAVEALADEWEREAVRFGWIGGATYRGAAGRLRAALLLHDAPSEVST